MDFESIVASITASFLILIRRFILLIFQPYQTVRKIGQEKDYLQVIIILLLTLVYFILSGAIRQTTIPVIIIYGIFLGNFIMTIGFFYLLAKLSKKDITLSSFIFTFSYSLLPTLIWFSANSLFYHFLPPPRTTSIWGKSFSVFFIAFSLSLLFWKIILVYLSLRFSAKQHFYRIVYYIILYLSVLTPYSFFLYQLRIFRIPFI